MPPRKRSRSVTRVRKSFDFSGGLRPRGGKMAIGELPARRAILAALAGHRRIQGAHRHASCWRLPGPCNGPASPSLGLPGWFVLQSGGRLLWRESLRKKRPCRSAHMCSRSSSWRFSEVGRACLRVMDWVIASRVIPCCPLHNRVATCGVTG